MKRSISCSLVLVAFLCFAVACGDDDAPDAAPIALFDATVPDAADPIDSAPPLDAQTFPLLAAVGLDEVRIVGGGTFLGLGSLVLGMLNGQIQDQIDNGTMLLALEWRNLDDLSGQNDNAVDIGFYQCDDPDGDPTNNFNATTPDRWVAQAASIDGDGQPTVEFLGGTIVDGALSAASSDPIVLDVPGLPIPLPIVISNPVLTGVMTAAPDNQSVHFLEDGTVSKVDVEAMLSGAITADTLGAAPGIPGVCLGNNLLDILALGCVTGFGIDILPSQPDADLDGDGLEKLCDDCTDPACGGTGDADAGVSDGIIDCCLDGDGTTVIEAPNCWTDPRIADGFIIELAIHGTRIILLSGVDPS